MAKSGGSAGIYNYRVDTSEIVLSTSIVQLLILSVAILTAYSEETLGNPCNCH